MNRTGLSEELHYLEEIGVIGKKNKSRQGYGISVPSWMHAEFWSGDPARTRVRKLTAGGRHCVEDRLI